MIKIDEKDRKILYHLDLDSRQSFRTIGRKVGLSKDVVTSRVKNLHDNGVIKNFFTAIDSYKLGYTLLRFYLTYQYHDQEVKKEIVDYFVKNNYSTMIHSVEGSYDLVVFMCVKNLTELYHFWEKTLDKYRNYFANQVFAAYFQERIYKYSFLLGDKLYEKTDRKVMEIWSDRNIVRIDSFDYQILELISPNARMPTTEIAKKLNSTAVTINNRIKNMISLGVIRRFRTNFDLSKLGYQLFKVDIVFKNHEKIHQVISYLESNPHFILIDRTLGYVDLELEFVLKSAKELHQIMDDIANKFPGIIKEYKYFSVIKTNKYNHLPGD